jgi:hypothetical protein
MLPILVHGDYRIINLNARTCVSFEFGVQRWSRVIFIQIFCVLSVPWKLEFENVDTVLFRLLEYENISMDKKGKRGIWNLEFGIWNLEFGIWNLEFGIWNLEFGIWNLEFGMYGARVKTIFV